MRRFMVQLSGVLIAACLTGAVACSAGSPWGSLSPEKCSAVRPQAEPDLMAWAPAERAALAAVREQGIALVHYEGSGCDLHLEVLSNCRAAGRYEFVPYWESEKKIAHDTNQLFAKLPIGAFSIAGKVKNDQAVRADYMLAGIAQIPIGVQFDAGQLVGDCSRATHVVTKMYLGGFALDAGNSDEIEASASIFAEAGGSTKHSFEHLQRAGDAQSCETSHVQRREDANCSVPLRISLVPLAEARGCLDPDECEQRCAKGDTNSCVTAGLMYGTGQIVKRDPQRAATLYRTACDRGNIFGCGDLGILYLGGDGVPLDIMQAQALLGRACDSGVPWACGHAAQTYESSNPSFAMASYMRGCGGGDEPSCQRAVVLQRAACDRNEAQSCFELANMLHAGQGAARDDQTARSLVEKACERGLKAACIEAGSYYLLGEGGPRDVARAITIYREGCDSGEPRGCYTLGIALYEGTGVAQNLGQAATLFEKGCDAGHGDSCAALGAMNEDGKSMPVNLDEAASLYTSACDLGSAGGCSALGSLYETGKGVPKDAQRALTFYQRACQEGEETACRARDRMTMGR